MPVPSISRPALLFFRGVVRIWFQLHFDRVLLLGDVPANGGGPLLVFGNHSSWWDPMIAVLLATKLMPGRRHFAPIDENALRQQWLLSKIGMFPVEINSARGARQLLQAGLGIAREDGVIWVTPQGRFADTREEPLGFKPGLAALANRLGCTLLPLATEYTFWNSRRPVAFAHFGKPLHGPVTTGQLETALAGTMAELKSCVLTRDAAQFRRVPLWSGVRA